MTDSESEFALVFEELIHQSTARRSASDPLVVIAAYDDRYAHLVPNNHPDAKLIVADTSAGGHPSKAFIDAYRAFPHAKEYLFLQDSLEWTVDAPLDVFRSAGSDVCAWGLFDMFYDSADQAIWVQSQYPPGSAPPYGIFGPIFYATNDAMRKAEPFFPKTPRNKLEAQGTERAWAFAFWNARVPFTALGGVTTDGVRPNLYPSDNTFIKHFGDRQ